jgi:hypothetical protein
MVYLSLYILQGLIGFTSKINPIGSKHVIIMCIGDDVIFQLSRYASLKH